MKIKAIALAQFLRCSKYLINVLFHSMNYFSAKFSIDSVGIKENEVHPGRLTESLPLGRLSGACGCGQE